MYARSGGTAAHHCLSASSRVSRLWVKIDIWNQCFQARIRVCIIIWIFFLFPTHRERKVAGVRRVVEGRRRKMYNIIKYIGAYMVINVNKPLMNGLSLCSVMYRKRGRVRRFLSAVNRLWFPTPDDDVGSDVRNIIIIICVYYRAMRGGTMRHNIMFVWPAARRRATGGTDRILFLCATNAIIITITRICEHNKYVWSRCTYALYTIIYMRTLLHTRPAVNV